jgi:hypothetical protein
LVWCPWHCRATGKYHKWKRMTAALCICSGPVNTTLSCWITVYQEGYHKVYLALWQLNRTFLVSSIVRLASKFSPGMIFWRVKSKLNLRHFTPAKHLYLRDEKNKDQYGGKSICNRKCQPYAVKLPVVW